MPGVQTDFSQRGETNEQFASLLLSELAFVTRVPRPMDVGHDLICVLKEPDERNPVLIRAGPSFTVQVKSNHEPLRFKNENDVEWLKNQEIPYFVCVVDRESFSIGLYSTWNVHNSYLNCDPASLTLKLDEEINPKTPTYPRSMPNCRELQYVPLGEPILNINIADIWDTDTNNHYREILKNWILLEQENIVNIRAKMHWVVGCIDYKTNTSIPAELNLFVYYNLPVNERFYIRNLGRTTTLLRLAIHHNYQGKEYDVLNNTQLVKVLDELLSEYWDHLDPEIRGLVQKQLEETES